MADFLDDPASDSSPNDSLSDSAHEIDDDLGSQSSFESAEESDRDGSRHLPPGRFTADTVAEVCTNANGPRCHKRKESSLDGSLRKRVCQERGQSSASNTSPLLLRISCLMKRRSRVP